MKRRTYFWCFHIEGYFLSCPFFFFLSLYPTVLPSTCHLMFLVQAALGSVTQVLVAFPDVAAGGGEIIIIWALPSFSPPVSCALFFFSLCCWSQDQICCRSLHHPSHLAMSVEIMLVLLMCRYALGVCVSLCSSCCVFGSEFLQSLSSLSPFKLPLRGYIEHLQTGRLHRCCRTQHSPASSIIGNLRGDGKIQCGMN